MTSRQLGIVPAAIVALSAWVGAAAGPEDSLAQLDEALKAGATFVPGSDAGPLRLIERLVTDALKDPAMREAVEGRLVRALRSDATLEAKAFLCRQLRTIGTTRAVPALEALLPYRDLSHMARYALERIEDPAAAAALHRALRETTGELQIGMIQSLGRRRHRPALPDLVRLLGSRDPAVAAAAAVALGDIGGPEAARALERARPGSSGELRVHIDDALLACAERFLAEGRTDDAARIYEAFWAPDRPKHLRIGALRGLVAARGARAMSLVVEAIRGPDPGLRASAIAVARTLEGPEVTKTLAGLVPSLAPEAQAFLLRVLGARGDARALPAVIAATRSGEEGVRVAALEALAGIGDATVVDLLVRAAATRQGGEQQAARSSLRALKGGDIVRALVQGLARGEPRVRIERIRALAMRRATEACGGLLRLAQGEGDDTVRREAVGALGRLAGASDLPALIGLLLRPKQREDRPAIEGTVAAMFRRIAAPEDRARPVIAALVEAPAEAKPVLLRLLGGAATAEALRAVRGALEDGNASVRDAALRTLAAWPDTRPARDLLRLARTPGDAGRRAIALGGYVRMAGLSEEPGRMYGEALELAATPQERKMVLAGLGSAGSKEALDLVERYLEERDRGVRTEAARAAVRIAGRVRRGDAQRARSALDRVIAAVEDPAVRQMAQDVINDMEKYEGYILAWRVAGPYRMKGKDSRAVFDAVLPPERPGVEEVAWKPLRRGIGSWDINLESQLGSFDHCAGYVRTRIESPVEQDARLELGSDDAIKAWLNGKLVHANYVSRGLSPRQDVVAVTLRKGGNDLLLKVVDHQGGWAFCCRVRKPDGSALEDLRVEAR